VTRSLVAILFASACTPTTAPPQTTDTATTKPEPTDSVAAVPEGGDWYVGVLGQRGTPDCPRGEQTWIDVEPTLGSTPTQPLADAESKWLDQPVVAHGLAGEPPTPRTRSTVTAECPTPQARSDWELTPRGTRVRRSGGKPAQFFVRDSLRPLAELTARQDGTQLVIDFRNPVPIALTDVAIVVHYEGCQGKPLTMLREHPVGALAVGAGVQAKLDTLTVGSRGPHLAYSVQIVATGTDVYFDLDVPVRVLGVQLECPERG